MPRQRLGVALLIPPPVGTEIDGLRTAVGDDDTGRIAPHVTLVPPVNVREDEIDAAVAVVQRAAASTPMLRLTLGPVTTFSPVSPTIHLEVGGDLDPLHRLRDAVFVPPLERNLTHPFVPHVTLTEESDRIDAAVAALRDYRAEVVLDRVHLMRESRDDDGVRIWRPIANALLGATPAVIGRGGLELELETMSAPSPEAARFSAEAWRQHDVDRFGEVRPPFEQLTIVARRDGAVVGVAIGELRDGVDAYLADLIVDRTVRGEGVGAHLLRAFESEAAKRGATYATLRTGAGERQHDFYLRHGWTDWYPMPKWRGGRDFVQMRREL